MTTPTPSLTATMFQERAEGLLKDWWNDDSVYSPSDAQRIAKALEQAYKDGFEKGKDVGFSECRGRAVKTCQSYADRNSAGEIDDSLMSWVSTYHRIAGENLRDDIRALTPQAGEEK